VFALPLTAVVVLRATTFQVGLLSSAATAAFALIALPAGAIVDRRAKRRLMIWCDLARMLIIGSVLLAGVLGVLTMGNSVVRSRPRRSAQTEALARVEAVELIRANGPDRVRVSAAAGRIRHAAFVPRPRAATRLVQPSRDAIDYSVPLPKFASCKEPAVVADLTTCTVLARCSRRPNRPGLAGRFCLTFTGAHHG
jgi:hypothetical protein